MCACSVEETVTGILSHHAAGKKEELIPILREIQNALGYLPAETMRKVSDFLNLSPSRVFGVATYYADFRLAPDAKKIVRVCQGPACHLTGTKRVLGAVESKLGIHPGENSADQEYRLEKTTCSGACALAPVMEINENTYGHMTVQKVQQILSDNK
jgi:NADH:ubiquinone oxidoreductase subunit E